MTSFFALTAGRPNATRRISTVFATIQLLILPAGAWATDSVDDGFSFHAEQFSKTSSSVRAVLPLKDGMLDTTGVASLDSMAGSFIRLESALNLDFADRSKRVRVGDTVSNPGTMGSAVRFAGLQVGTPFETRSDLLMANRLALAGTAIVPTSLDAMLATKPAAAGRFSNRRLSLQRTPQPTQRSGMAFVTRDGLGQSNTLTRTLLPTYAASVSGCDNFSIGVGRARVDYALASNSYGRVFANSTVLCALDSGFAVEAHGEYLQGENGVAGLSVFKPIGPIGTASMSIATSENGNGSGWLLRAGLQHANDRFDFNLRAHIQSPEYREIGATIVGDSVEQRFVASAGGQLTDRNLLSLAFVNQTTYGLQQTNALAVSNNIDLGARGSLAIAAHRAIDSNAASRAAKTEDNVTMTYTKKLKK